MPWLLLAEQVFAVCISIFGEATEDVAYAVAENSLVHICEYSPGVGSPADLGMVMLFSC